MIDVFLNKVLEKYPGSKLEYSEENEFTSFLRFNEVELKNPYIDYYILYNRSLNKYQIKLMMNAVERAILKELDDLFNTF